MGTVDFVVAAAFALACLAVGVGFALVADPWHQYGWAKLCFCSGAALFAAAGLVWGLTTVAGIEIRAPLCGILGALAMIGAVEGLRVHPASAQPTSGPPASPAPPKPSGSTAAVNGSNYGTVIGSVGTINNKTVVVHPKETAPVKPEISFEKVAFFWVPLGDNNYDIVVVAKLFNATQKAYKFGGFGFDHGGFGFQGRGGWHMQQWNLEVPQRQAIEDSYIKSGNEGYYKLRFDARIHMTPGNGRLDNSGPPPIVLGNANWFLLVDGKRISLKPEFWGTFDRIISDEEWQDLTRPDSKIDINNIRTAAAPK